MIDSFLPFGILFFTATFILLKGSSRFAVWKINRRSSRRVRREIEQAYRAGRVEKVVIDEEDNSINFIRSK